ncbi:MAG: hypothetical protein ABUT20_51555 [Bacteroidota bacterium]
MLKRTALTAGYYVISFAIIFLLNDVSPSGPCTPGLGALGFLVIIPLSIILLFRNIYVTAKVGKENLLATIIHATACVFMISPWMFS